MQESGETLIDEISRKELSKIWNWSIFIDNHIAVIINDGMEIGMKCWMFNLCNTESVTCVDAVLWVKCGVKISTVYFVESVVIFGKICA